MSEELTFKTITELAPLIRSRKLSPVELTRAYLERIEALDGELRSYITVLPERALAQARAAETAIGAGACLGPLHGIPIAFKDLIDVAGLVTTAGSVMLKENVAAADAPVAARLARAGTVLLGKTNMVEWAFGADGLNPHYGMPKNPWDKKSCPGGSSSGSGVAVGAALAAAALGSDTGGSVRIPAALCGIVGLKGTFGRVPNTGVVPLGTTKDSVGPMTRCVADAALLYGAMAGRHAGDPDTWCQPVPDFPVPQAGALKGARLGVVRELLECGLHPEVERVFRAALPVFEEAGARLEEVSLPRVLELFNISAVEGLSVHEDFWKDKWHLMAERQRSRFEGERDMTAPEYIRALRTQREIQRDILGRMRGCDALLAPTTCIPPMPPEEYDAQEHNYAALTRWVNNFALCAVSLPCGFDDRGMPIALQIVGRPWDEANILDLAYDYEQRAGWREKRPGL